MTLRKGIVVCLALALAGCALPQAGPTSTQIERSADPGLDVYLVRLSTPIVNILSRSLAATFPPSFRLNNHTPSVALKPGDVVGISIYEAGGTPLFSPGAGGPGSSVGAPGQQTPQPTVGSSQAAVIPGQIVEPDGQVLVPFVGPVPVVGQTPSQAAKRIASRLEGKTASPQVIVSLLSNNANTVTVGGEANRAGLVPLTLRGERLLDVIAQAGGPRFPAFETDVRLMRGDNVASVPLQDILSSPRDNIIVQPKDAVVLVRNPKTFVVLGAAMKVSQYNMDAERVTLAEGIARAGGTVDAVGNLSAIYLMRSEPTSRARSIMAADRGAVDGSFVETDQTRTLAGPQVRMIYRLDLTRSDGYFYAQNIVLRDKDIVLIANAETAQLQKALQVLRGFTGAYFDLSRGASFYYQ
jgi:polysaccharide export outer membrane protein